MDDLEEVRRRKLRDLQERQAARSQDPEAARAEEEGKAREQEAIESFLQQVLDGEARERLTRIRMSRPDFAEQVARQLVALAQAGRLRKRLSDDEFRAILAQLGPDDRDISITRR